jgi:tripartite-type tricarboxylate transporter receptor subunit TctC
MIRRAWTGVPVLLLALLRVTMASADDYPSRPVTIVAPAPPGAVTDFVARTVAQHLSGKWGQSVVVENRPGGGTLIGAAVVARAKPDGYTLLAMTNTPLVNATLHKKMPFDPLQDLTPVAFVADVPFVLVVNPSLPVNNLQELISYAKARPGQLTYGTAGVGTMHHLSGEMLQQLTGIKMLAVPYGGSLPAMTDVVSGHTNLVFVEVGTARELINAGKLRALGVTTPTRVSMAAEIPTIAEAGVPGFAAVSWQSITVTGGTPNEIVAKLNRDINEGLASPETRNKILALGMVPKDPQSTIQLMAFMKAEFDHWARVITDVGLAQSQ